MSYQYDEEELYGRALFFIKTDTQTINIAFEPDQGESYVMIIFTEDGTEIKNPHDNKLWDVLYEILQKFNNKRNLNYTIVAV